MKADSPSDPLLDPIRTYLRQHFGEIIDESSQGNYKILTVDVDGKHRTVSVHEDFLVYPADSIADYLETSKLAENLLTSNVDIVKPLQSWPNTQSANG